MTVTMKQSSRVFVLTQTILILAGTLGATAQLGAQQLRQNLYGHQNTPQGNITCVAFSADGKRLASAGTDKQVFVFQNINQNYQQVYVIPQNKHTEMITSVAFSPDGKMLATASLDKTVRLWDAANGKEIRTLSDHKAGVMGVAFSNDSKFLASGSLDKTVKIWDVSSGNVTQTLEGHLKEIACVAFSPDGKLVASGSMDKTTRVWDAATGKEKFKIAGPGAHIDTVYAVAFSPDGKVLASASKDAKVILVGTDKGDQLQVLEGHKDWATGPYMSIFGLNN